MASSHHESCRSLLSRKRCTLIRRLNDELINVCGQSLKLFFAGLKNCLIAKFAPEGFYRLVYMLRCSKADFEEVDFFVWKPYYYNKPEFNKDCKNLYTWHYINTLYYVNCEHALCTRFNIM